MAIRITIPASKKKIVFPKFDKLPGKPSALIRIAITDLVKSEKKGLKVDMGSWLALKYKANKSVRGATKVCTVCFAGAVMANTLSNKPEVQDLLEQNGTKFNLRLDHLPYVPEDGSQLDEVDTYIFGKDEAPLDALNSFRLGHLEEGFSDLRIKWPENLMIPKVEITPYHVNKNKFKTDMRELATALARIGY